MDIPPVEIREDIDGRFGLFSIDEIVAERWRRGELTEHWINQTHAVGFARRTLDVATASALGAIERLNRHETLLDYDEMERVSQEALDALTHFAKHCGGGAFREFPEASLKPAFSKLVSTTAPGGDHEAEVNSRVQIILSAIDTLREFTAFAVSQRDRIVAMGVQNPGDPIKAAFVMTMAEGWVALTGKVPGKGTRVSQNPFLRFAATGWRDVGGDFDPDLHDTFAQSALASAVGELQTRLEGRGKDYKPDWA